MSHASRSAKLAALSLLLLCAGCVHHAPASPRPGVACSAPPVSPADSIVGVGSVTTPPMQLRTSRSPRLNFAHPGQPARVSLAFVVDTLGRVERCGARVTEATPFDAADGVLEQLYRVRFTPGTLNGHKVRTALGLVIETNGEVIRTP